MQLDPRPAVISNLGTSYFYLHRYPEAEPEAAVADLKKGLRLGLTTTSVESDPEFESLRKRSDCQALMNQYASRKK